MKAIHGTCIIYNILDTDYAFFSQSGKYMVGLHQKKVNITQGKGKEKVDFSFSICLWWIILFLVSAGYFSLL